MIESSVAHSAPTNTVVDRIEREIARLKAARPHLESRIERALRRPSDSTGGGCAGCSAPYPASPGVELFEVLDSLTFFEGDLVCRKCADGTASETV